MSIAPDPRLAQARRLLDAGFAAEALALLEALPRDVGTARWLAEAQRLRGADDDAARTLDDAMATTPGHPVLAVARSEMELSKGDLAGAARVLDGAEGSAVLEQRARIALASRNVDGAVGLLRQSIDADPANISAQSAFIVAASGAQDLDTQALKALQRRWRGPAPLAAAWPAGPRQRLRVGYVSRAFNRNAVSKVIAPALLRHDPARVESFLYSTSRQRDEISLRFRKAAAQWRAIAGLSDSEAVAQIRRDRIDILVDIDGHFFANRLGIFALRAAPVQVCAWGYVPGAGIAGIDALLTDTAIARGEDALYPEQLVRLSQAQPYDAGLRPRMSAAGPRAPGAIRFGCFHRSDKLNDATLALWANILAAIPGATLTFKSKYLAGAVRDGVVAVFAKAGIDPARLLFEPEEPHDAYLAAFDRIDVALDPSPVNGGLVTLDGLSQGVPALTRVGPAPHGRIGASILRAAALDRFVCSSPRAYVETAIGLARDADGLDALRASTRQAARRLFGAERCASYVSEVEEAYRQLWQRRAT